MKILQIYKDYYPPVTGGIEKHLNILCKGLKERDIDVEVLVSSKGPKLIREYANGILITKAPEFGRISSAPMNLTFPLWLRRLGEKADILHFHFPNPTSEFSYLISGLKKNIVVTYHSDIVRQVNLKKLYSPFLNTFLKKSRVIIATTPNYISCSDVLHKFREKCQVVHLGIDLSEFERKDRVFLQKVEDIKRKYGTGLILFVGRFRYYKGLPVLIKTMKEVNGKLLLIGGGGSEDNIHDQIKASKLQKKVFLLGELSDEEVLKYYYACDILVLPSISRSEAFGLVQLEAMACKKPVICTELGTGTSFVNCNEKTGMVIPPNDVYSLANAINFMLGNKNIQEKYGEAGYKRVHALFSAESMVENTVAIYKSIYERTKYLRNIYENKTRKTGIELTKIGRNEKKAKIKILRVISRLNIGGPSIHCSILSKGLNNKRFASKVVTGTISPFEGDMDYLFNKNGHIIRVPELQREINFRKDFLAFFRIIRIVFQEKPDIVHTHMAKAGAVSRVAVFFHNLVSRKKIRTVHTYHGHVLEGYFSPLMSKVFILIEKVLARTTDAIIAISRTQMWELSEKYKVSSGDKIHTINLGFDLTRFANKNGGGKLRALPGVDDKTLLIGIVGRLVPIKNHVLFLDAAKLIKERSENGSIRFVIVGDGALCEKLKAYAGKIGIRKNVIFYGWEKDIRNIYSDIDILLLTSNNEGTPVSIIEAIASKVPVVTTGVGGVKDLLGRIENGQKDGKGFKICERGILCPKGDAEAIANGVEYLIENKNNNKIQRAQEFVLKNYSDKRLIRDIEKLYCELMSKQ